MRFLSSIPQFPTEVLLALGAVGFLLLVWLCARIIARYIAAAQAESTDLILVQLARIADAIERSSLPLRHEPRPNPEQKPARHVSMSMLGR